MLSDTYAHSLAVIYIKIAAIICRYRIAVNTSVFQTEDRSSILLICSIRLQDFCKSIGVINLFKPLPKKLKLLVILNTNETKTQYTDCDMVMGRLSQSDG